MGRGAPGALAAFHAVPAGVGRRCAIEASVGSHSGMPSAAVGPKRASTAGEITIGSIPATPGTVARAPVATTGICSASRSSRRHPASRMPASCSATRGSEIQRSTSGCAGESATNAARAIASGWGVKTVRAAPSKVLASSSTPSTRPSTARWDPIAALSQPGSASRPRSLSWM